MSTYYSLGHKLQSKLNPKYPFIEDLEFNENLILTVSLLKEDNSCQPYPGIYVYRDSTHFLAKPKELTRVYKDNCIESFSTREELVQFLTNPEKVNGVKRYRSLEDFFTAYYTGKTYY